MEIDVELDHVGMEDLILKDYFSFPSFKRKKEIEYQILACIMPSSLFLAVVVPTLSVSAIS